MNGSYAPMEEINLCDFIPVWKLKLKFENVHSDFELKNNYRKLHSKYAIECMNAMNYILLNIYGTTILSNIAFLNLNKCYIVNTLK